MIFFTMRLRQCIIAACFLPALLLIFPSFIAAQDKYHFTIDLLHSRNDQVNITLDCPRITETEVRYALPKIVPGTYAIYDFGRFIEDFKAFDANGNALGVTHTDANSWTISEAQQLARITYRLNDTYDAFGLENPVFEPAGSNIQTDSNYVLNTFTCIGYFENRQHIPYDITVLHRPDFFGSTSMTDLDQSAGKDLFSKPSYHELADHPLMYSVPDTATVQVGNCNVLISVYSPNKIVPAKFIAGKMDTLLQAQGKYLGGKLPVDKYAFIIYLDHDEGISGAQGALEHSYCSMYYLPEVDRDVFMHYFIDFAAHEFFHIITPLNIHSEEIQYFDFSNPEMSEHLWLYEGTTEYHAFLVQKKYGLLSRDEFLEAMRDKMITAASSFNDTLPFTKMSKGCLDEYKDQFINVYMKGALIALCLDIKLLSMSGGKYGIQELIADLSNRYGKNRPFKDETLFDTIGSITSPEIRNFLTTYIGGSTPLPFQSTFREVGIEYLPMETKNEITFGKIAFDVNPDNGRMIVASINARSEFGRAIGYREGDEIITINGTEIYASNFVQFRNTWLSHVKEGDQLTVVVKRSKASGKTKESRLKTKVFRTETTEYHVLRLMAEATPEQIALQNAWLSP